MHHLKSLFTAVVVLFCGLATGQVAIETPRFDLNKLRKLLSGIESLDVRYCEIGMNGREGMQALSKLVHTSYSEIVSNGSIPRDADSVLEQWSLACGRYRFAGQRELLELDLEIPEANATRSITYALGKERAVKVLNRIDGKNYNASLKIPRHEYFLSREGYLDPTLLFMHYYRKGTRISYIDMLDCGAPSVESVGDWLTVKTHFRMTGRASEPVVDAGPRDSGAYFMEIRVHSDTLLPHCIRFGPVDQSIWWQRDIPEYIEQNGFFFPERGVSRIYVDNKCRFVNLFIVDPATLRLNPELSEEELTLENYAEILDSTGVGG